MPDEWWLWGVPNLYMNNIDSNLDHNRFVCEWLVVGLDDWARNELIFSQTLYVAYQTCDKAYELMTRKDKH